MNVIVAKFGGTSLANAQAIKRSVEVAKREKGLGVVVVSATGGTTDTLVELWEACKRGKEDNAAGFLKKLESRHRGIAQDLGVSAQGMEEWFQLARKKVVQGIGAERGSRECCDALFSVGEGLSAVLFAQVLSRSFSREVELLDARDVIKTNDQFGRALPVLGEISRTCEKLREKLKGGVVFVTQGFVGSTLDGKTTTLGRSGSDYSAALFAEGVGAKELQIWTDVSGVFTTDPRICSKAQPIEELSFSEAAELATFGAKVLHPTTVWPAMRKKIPIYIRNSLAPHELGTRISSQAVDTPLVRGIALRESQSILTLVTPRMVSVYGFLHDIFLVFKEHKVSVDLVTTSEISVSLTVDDFILEEPDLIKDLSHLGTVNVEKGYSLVALIGNRINQTPCLGRQILDVIAPANIRLLSCGASEHNFCFLLNAQEARGGGEKDSWQIS